MAEIDRNKGLNHSSHLVDVRNLPPALPDELSAKRQQRKAKVAEVDLETPLEIGRFQTGGMSIEQRRADEADLTDLDSILTVYLDEMGRIPMVDATAERDLAQQVANGDKDAMRRLMEVNLRLVVSEAKKYMGRGLPLLDLIQEGNLGLHRGIELFDLNKKNRLSTYAVPWIRNFLAAATSEQSRVISITRTEVSKLGQIHEAVRTLELLLGRDPSVEEIANVLKMKPQFVLTILERTTPAASLETPVGDGENTLGDMVANKETIRAQTRDVSDEKVYAVLKERLNDQELLVIQMRYLNFNPDWRPTMRELAGIMEIPHQTVEYLEKSALRKLRDKQVEQVLRGLT